MVRCVLGQALRRTPLLLLREVELHPSADDWANVAVLGRVEAYGGVGLLCKGYLRSTRAAVRDAVPCRSPLRCPCLQCPSLHPFLRAAPILAPPCLPFSPFSTALLSTPARLHHMLW